MKLGKMAIIAARNKYFIEKMPVSFDKLLKIKEKKKKEWKD